MKKQQKMISCFYKKVSVLLIVAVLLASIKSSYASRIMWPSAMNLYNDTIDFDKLVTKDATSSNSKKGFLFTGNPQEVFDLGCGQIAINVALSGKGHTYMQFLEGFKKRGIKITLILINDRPPIGASGKGAPKDFQNPYFYMIDFDAVNGEWQKYNFDRIVEDYAPYVDNWVIGNEINSQLYNFYGPCDVLDYTKVYCKNFKKIYDQIKTINKDADFYISFDQCWDMPEYRAGTKYYNKELGKYRYNAKTVINLINQNLSKDVEWGVALHPYPTPIEEGMFWDDEYAGYDVNAAEKKERPYLISSRNFEVALAYMNEKELLYKGKQRKILLSEVAVTSHNGEEIQAAGLYYIWEKIVKYDSFIEGFLYNAQTDLDDGYNFGLTSDKGRKRISWAVFRDMDTDRNAWCKDLLDRVLEEHGYEVEDVFIKKIEKNEDKKETSAIIKRQ